MNSKLRWILYILLAVFALLSFYSIFNAGNPESLFRAVIADPAYDVTITLALSTVVVLLSVLLIARRENDPVRNLLELNAPHIRDLRRQGKSEEAIAESFLQSLGARQGLLYALARRKVLRYLSRME